MRDFSSSAHVGPISDTHDERVLMTGPLPDDEVLPAAAHLAGPRADAVLRTALSAVGGELRTSRPAHVQYRPGSDVVVRFDATVSWSGAAPVTETLVAATTGHGIPPGTLPVVAEADGRELHVGVWRWPFDPHLVGLGTMVTPASAAKRLGGLVRGPVDLEVVAYRPTERTVVRVTDADGIVRYVKVLPPPSIAPVVERHAQLREAGIPVPVILAADDTDGWLVMEELAGDTLRLRLKDHRPPWPTAAAYDELLSSLWTTELPSATPVRARTLDGMGHAAMLATVLPDQSPRLDRLRTALGPAAERAAERSGPTVHGDLYEAQLIVDGQQFTGLLDVDDAGPGDPLDDLATVLGHLRYREITDRLRGRAIGGYADALRRDFLGFVDRLGVEPRELDVVTGAVLVGLATGPFRVQHRGWKHEARRLLTRAERTLTGKAADAAG